MADQTGGTIMAKRKIARFKERGRERVSVSEGRGWKDEGKVTEDGDKVVEGEGKHRESDGKKEKETKKMEWEATCMVRSDSLLNF